MDNKNTSEKKVPVLTGYKKAIPIILAALAIFIAICYISSGTGAFGQGVSYVLLGLFSWGAYLLPALLLLHAAFFADDLAKGRILSRAVFSFVAMLIVCSIEYTLFFWDMEALFEPAVFFAERSAGGFIGGTVAFCITKLLGPIGLIILDVAVVVTYAIIFFGRKDSASRRALLAVLESGASLLAVIEKKIKKSANNRKEARAENKRLETERRHAEFLDDQFFDVDGNMDELRIRELGIHESKDKVKSEKKPSLQTKVFNKSAVLGEDVPESVPVVKRKPDFDHVKPEAKDSKDSDASFFKATDSSFKEKKHSYGIDESADSVFTKDFDPFDFATGEKLVAKQSTKAVSHTQRSGIDELLTPISDITEESVTQQKRREAFEASKQSYFAKRGVTPQPQAEGDVIKEPTAEEPAVTAPEKEPTAHFSMAAKAHDFRTAPISATMEFGQPEAETEVEVEVEAQSTPQKTVEFTVNNTPTYIAPESDNTSISKAYEKPEPEVAVEPEVDEAPTPAEEDAEYVAEQVAARVLMNNPAYARSANKSTFTTIVHEDDAAPSAEEAPEPSVEDKEPVTESETRESSEESEAVFKPYTPPSADAGAATAEYPIIVDRTLVTERSLLTPTIEEAPDSFLEKEIERYNKIEEDTDTEGDEQKEEVLFAEEPFNAEPAPAERVVTTEMPLEFTESTDNSFEQTVTVSENGDDEGTVFSFDNEENTEDTVEPEEEESAEVTEIPPEEQNPDVIKQRAMFPFLDAETSVADAEEAADDEAEPSSDIDNESVEENTELHSESEAPVIEEDAPPFDIEESAPVIEEAKEEEIKTAAPLPVPVKEKPKKKDYTDYKFPPIDLLHLSTEQNNENIAEEIQDNADKLIDTLASFGVTASIKGVDRGPRITRYEVVPAKGVKVSQIMNLADDIALNLAADGIRMEAPIPGKSAVGVEIPNKKSSIVRLRELIETDDFRSLKSKTSVCMGKDVAGQPVFADIAKMPHALIAGATGMGKSVCINSLMLSILYKARPDEVKFIMIDPKQVEFTMYNGIPHLLVPVVTDVKQAAGTLMWAVEEMERRYGVLQEMYVRNIDAYNEKVQANPALGEPMSRIVIVIDEFAELIMQAKNPVESLIIRIAQKARAAGIHLLIGTQKPVKEVITGLIKSNIPSKFSCKVASNRDSILIFDAAGAEKLLDKGDMLVAFANSLKPLRVQSAFVADDEVEAVMDYLKQSSDGASYDEDVMEEIRRAADKCSKKGGGDHDDDDGADESYGEGYLNDKQFLDAVEIAVNTGKISTSLIQRKLSIGYGKAAKFIDIMEDLGVVGEPNGSKPREVLMSADEWHEKLARATLD
ncbi:MAG: DNA translocase FtsK [Clostridia bacterium]|nr:DNA translocase FtsK [Clostridia bacterium]